MLSHQAKLDIEETIRTHLKARPHEELRDAAKRRRGDPVAEAVMNANGLPEVRWQALKSASMLAKKAAASNESSA